MQHLVRWPRSHRTKCCIRGGTRPALFVTAHRHEAADEVYVLLVRHDREAPRVKERTQEGALCHQMLIMEPRPVAAEGVDPGNLTLLAVRVRRKLDRM
eukprot:12311687-Prorocentrum_lima.AAC.1